MSKVSDELLNDIEFYEKFIIDNYNSYRKDCQNDLGFDVGFEVGSKYVKIMHWYDNGSRTQRTVHSFIEIKTGDIWKAASWRAPARNFPRGNVTRKEFGTIRWTGC